MKDRAQIDHSSDIEALMIYIDIYKHHFDLFLKGYIFYLAVIGAIAGLVFSNEVDAQTSQFLLFFMSTVSVMAILTWSGGLFFLLRFIKTMNTLSITAGVPLLPSSMFVWVLSLGLVASIVISVGTIYLLLI